MHNSALWQHLRSLPPANRIHGLAPDDYTRAVELALTERDEYLQTGGTLEVKTIAIISFALCGFANFGSIGVVVGAFSAISPKRAPEIAQLGLRALAAATLSNLMSATIAGFFIGLA